MKKKQGIYIPLRFNTMLKRVLQKKITFITAPAGYGKTTIVRHWSQLSRLSFIWLEITDSFNNPKTLLTHLRQISNELVNEKVVITLDHVHRLKEPKALSELTKWMIKAPAHVTFILLARTTLSSIKNISELQRQTFQLGAKELKFSREEAEVWVLQQSSYSIDLTEDQLTDLYTITDGCPILLQLASQHHLQNNSPLTDEQGRVAPVLEDYVLTEWLGQLPDDTWEQLRPLSIPPYVSFEFAREIIQTEINPLFRILEQQLLLTKFSVSHRWLHRFHPLVRAILKERLPLPSDEWKISEKTALFLEKEGFLREAVDMAIQARNSKLALQYIKKLAPNALMIHDYQTLHNWFNLLNLQECSQDKETLSLYNWVITIMNLSADTGKVKQLNHLITDTKEDQWTPFIPLNQGSMPFIRSNFGIGGDTNEIVGNYQVTRFQDKSLAFTPFRQLAIAEAFYEQNDLSAARQSLEQVWLSKRTNDQPGLSIPALWLDLLCHQSEGRVKKVHYLAEEIYYRSLQTPIPIWKRIGEAVKTYVLLQEGFLDDAEEWLSEQKELLHIYWNEWTCFEYFIFARALLVFQEAEEASNLLNRMVTSKSLEKNQGVQLKRRILQTIAAIKLEQQSEARIYLQEALEIGYTYGYTRAFLDEDPTLFLLFPNIEKDLPDHLQLYSNQLLKLGYKEELMEMKTNPKLKEALTLREIEIIKCIQNGLSNQAIGEQMNIKEGTVKGHLNRIYKKLNVRNRVQAVKTAEQQLLI